MHGSCFASLRQLDGALEVFRVEHDRYPTQAEGLSALANRPADIPAEKWSAYLKEVYRDPWGNDYVYRYPGIHNTNSFDLYSLGENGRSKTGGNDQDDINNWNESRPWLQYYRKPPVYDWSINAALLIVATLCLIYARNCRLRRKRDAGFRSAVAKSIEIREQTR